jgi:serine/threonine protein kinase
MVGTPYYLAPEAIEGVSSIEGDLWSLGVLIYVLLMGKYPFNGESPADIL